MRITKCITGIYGNNIPQMPSFHFKKCIMANKSKELVTFILGAAVGAAVGYILASDNKEEILSGIKKKASKLKQNLEEQLEKGKELIGELKGKAIEATESL